MTKTVLKKKRIGKDNRVFVAAIIIIIIAAVSLNVFHSPSSVTGAAIVAPVETTPDVQPPVLAKQIDEFYDLSDFPYP